MAYQISGGGDTSAGNTSPAFTLTSSRNFGRQHRLLQAAVRIPRSPPLLTGHLRSEPLAKAGGREHPVVSSPLMLT